MPPTTLASGTSPLSPRAELEPGLIAIYRTFAALHLIISLLGAILAMQPDSDISSDSRIVFTIIWQALLLLYLYYPQLEARWGQFYLPGALVFGSIMPLIGRFLLMNPALMGDAPDAYNVYSQ